jgi:uncharacterized protein
VILVDAGPLVALIHADDQHHQRCKEALATLRQPMLTVWPAFTKAMYLLNFSGEAQDALWDILESDALWMADLTEDDYPRVQQLMRKYRDLPIDLADAALVRVAERERLPRIFTIDRRDFEIYRPTGIRRFEILP